MGLPYQLEVTPRRDLEKHLTPFALFLESSVEAMDEDTKQVGFEVENGDGSSIRSHHRSGNRLQCGLPNFRRDGNCFVTGLLGLFLNSVCLNSRPDPASNGCQ